MKRIISNVMLVAAAATAFFSCQKQETFISDASQERLLTITSEKPTFVDKSRTEWNGETIQWSEGDRISVAYTLDEVFKGQYKNDEEGYTIPKLYKSKQLGEDTEVAKFDVSVEFKADASAEGKYVFYGVYPAPQETDFPNAPYATLEVPKTQTPEPNSFDRNSDLMIGVSVDEYSVWPTKNVSMLWTRLVAHANITLKALNGADASEQVLSIKLTAQADAKLVGNLEVNLLNREVAIGNASNVIELKGSNLAIDKDRNIEFWACLLPETLTSLTVVVETNKATYTRDITRISKTLTFTKNARNTLAIDMSTAERVEKVATAYYEKVTSQLEDWSGKYLIVFGNNAHATQDNKDLKATVTVAIEGNKIAASDDYANAVMTVTKVGSKYNMSFANGKYLAVKHNSTSSSSDPFELDFEYTDAGVKISGEAINDGVTSTYFLYKNDNNGSPLYRFYVDKSGNVNYAFPTLFRLSESNEGGGETPEQPTTPVLTVDPSEIEVEAVGGDKEITYTVENPVEGNTVSASTTVDWISDFNYTTAGKVSFSVAENIGEARNGKVTLSYEGADSKEVTVTQAGKPAEGGPTEVIDVLTRETTGVTGTNYKAWTYTSATTCAAYAGNSAGGNESIQLRSKDNAGIVTTTSGGYLKKVLVAWNDNTYEGRTLVVYGKNAAYSATSDLYDDSTCGTKLGEIVNGTTELVINGDYQYIGICSKDGALYLTNISITWSNEPGSGESPSEPEPEPTPDPEEPETPVYASLAELVAAGAPTTTGNEVTVTLDKEEIKSIYKSGNYRNGVYLNVGENDILIYCWNVPESWVEGGTISGTLTDCVWKLYDTTWELCPADWSELTYEAPEGGSTEPEEPAAPVVATVAQFLAAAEDDVVYEITGVITRVDNTEYGNFYLADSTGEVLIYGLCSPTGEQKYWQTAGVEVGDIITVRTVRTSYNETPQGKNALYVSDVNFYIDHTEINVTAEQTTAKFDLSVDVGYTIEYPEGVTEFSDEHNNDTATATYTVEFPANEDAEIKTYEIKIVADASFILENPIEGVEYARTITITQAAAQPEPDQPGGKKTYTLTINSTDLQKKSGSGYEQYNGSHKLTATAADNSTMEVEIKTSQVMPGSNPKNTLQFQASKGILYNVTDLGTITSVTYEVNKGDGFSHIIGTSQEPTTSSEGGAYFVVKKSTKNAGYLNRIIITFQN